jgi:hypothetical protein
LEYHKFTHVAMLPHTTEGPWIGWPDNHGLGAGWRGIDNLIKIDTEGDEEQAIRV